MCQQVPYLNPDLQKAFLPTLPGVTEHQTKLATIIKTAKRKNRSLAVAWLDIANAYGSVHHSLIDFSLAHYHAPPEFRRLLRSWYDGLSATISTNEWATAPVPLRIGVYQGDPLSVVVFLTVMNTLSDTLNTRNDLGFTPHTPSASINDLLYADDACIVNNTSAGCQHLLDLVQCLFSLGPAEGEGAKVLVTSPPGFDWEESFCRTLHWWSDHPTCGGGLLQVSGHACEG